MASVLDPSNGNTAKVDSNRRLHIAGKASPLQHIVSEENQQAYQAQGHVTLVNGTGTALHIKNVSTDKNVIITFIRLQMIDPVASIPEAETYAVLSENTTVASGGAPVTPVNMFLGHSNAAEVEATSGSTPIVTGGTATEFDRWYPVSDGDSNTYNKEGVLIIPPQQSINVSMVSGTAGGALHVRISFIMEAPDV